VSSNQAIAQSPRHALECITVIGLVIAALVVSRGRGVASWMAELAFLGFAAFRLLPAMQQLFGAVVRIRANQALFDEIAADMSTALRNPGSAATDVLPPSDLDRSPRRELCFVDVDYQHADAASGALAGIDLRIPAGSLVAVTGANGSGKSTLLEIAAGLRAPSRGCVRVDGIELTADNRAAWRRSLSYAPQDPVVLDTTLAGNIAFGLPEAEWDRQRLELAVRQANLTSLVAELPGGLSARVGDGGQRLSGGQRQRLGIARALYRDAALLLLDEPTSSLDGMTERELLGVLSRMRGRCTIILVTHRPALVRECDLVVELDRGRRVDVRPEPATSAPPHAEVSNPHAKGRAAQGAPQRGARQPGPQ
jgi:HlyD family secretion protein